MLNIIDLKNFTQKLIKDAFLSINTEISKCQKVEYELDRDVKILADKKLESFIIEKLQKEYSYPILSEETGIVGGKINKLDYYWIIDPLDGSLNFSREIPICCISIALWKGLNPIMGVVYDFNRNEIFSGIVGEGATLNGDPITVSKTENKKKAILCTGFPVSTDFSEKVLMSFVDDIRQYKKIRLFGSAALSLSYVACGRTDAYLENHIKLWDVAAGLALVKAAGGTVEIISTNIENAYLVKASNSLL